MEENYGPYRQSERKEIYEEYIKLLLKKEAHIMLLTQKMRLSDERETAEKKGRRLNMDAQNRMFLRTVLN